MFKLASSIGFALALADLKRRVRHWVRSGILGAIGAVLFVIGLCFLLAAAHLWLSDVLNPIASAAIIGGALVAIALILCVLASLPMRARAAKQPAAVGDAVREGVAKLGEAAGSAQSPLRNPVFQAAGLALLAGFFLGRRSRRDKD